MTFVLDMWHAGSPLPYLVQVWTWWLWLGTDWNL